MKTRRQNNLQQREDGTKGNKRTKQTILKSCLKQIKYQFVFKCVHGVIDPECLKATDSKGMVQHLQRKWYI